MNFATLTLTAANREIKRHVYAKKKVQVFSFLPDETAWLVVLYVLCKVTFVRGKFQVRRKIFTFLFLKHFPSQSVWHLLCRQSFFVRRTFENEREIRKETKQKMLIFSLKAVLSRKGPLKFNGHFNINQSCATVNKDTRSV